MEKEGEVETPRHLWTPPAPPQLARDAIPTRRPRDAARSTLPTAVAMVYQVEVNLESIGAHHLGSDFRVVGTTFFWGGRVGATVIVSVQHQKRPRAGGEI